VNEPLPAVPRPLVVLGGYLGAGKTTLVNRLLREAGTAGRRVAVLVNDFGEVSIDADLVVGAEGGVLALAGGCVCCSYGADLLGAVGGMAARAPPPDVLLVETSGVGLPAAVARTAALAPGVRVEGLVVLADAAAVRAQAADRYVGGTVRQQLREADLVLLSKADLAGAAEAAAVAAWLRDEGLARQPVTLPAPQRGPGAAGGDDAAGAVALIDLVFGPDLGRPPRPAPAAPPATAAAAAAAAEGEPSAPRAFAPRPLGHAPAASRFESHTRRFVRPVDARALGASLLGEGVLRAKGLLLDEAGQWQALQVAGGRLHLDPWRGPPPARGGDEAAGRLVTITLRRD
jgi:G3E family GTPase